MEGDGERSRKEERLKGAKEKGPVKGLIRDPRFEDFTGKLCFQLASLGSRSGHCCSS